MIPLSPAYAVTIHKSQGMSLDKVIIDLGDDEFCNGLTYVALSRCKTISNVALINFPKFTRIRDLQKTSNFMERLREDKKCSDYQKRTLKHRRL